VQILSAGRGKGTEVRMYLPLERGISAVPEWHKPPENGKYIVPQRVLIVDDNRDAAAVLATVVGRLGHDVRLAYDGVEAIEVAESFSPEVVFLDLGMPVLDGFGAARELRNKPWGREMLLVALTGWGQHGDKLRAKEAGFDHHLVKPADSEQIMSIFLNGCPQTIESSRQKVPERIGETRDRF
jgi:CheY-like chemotaxis protein